MPFGRRKDERMDQCRMSTTSRLQLADGYSEAPARDHVSIIMDEIEAALRTKRHFRHCLSRLLKKDDES